ncbi:MAG: DUF427 domain-containing protein [Gemmatimonadota bacterium]|nr:MAG: DUF427 domain-containing protein [Gemmatimonadota bacterium]
MNELPPEIRGAREKWRYSGQRRPDFAREPGPGQESVWDYPRPPCLNPDTRFIEVARSGVTVAKTRRAVRMLETASPPTFYLPPEDVSIEYLEKSRCTSICEWKGTASYWSLRLGDMTLRDVAWSYEDPSPGFESISGYLSFYPARVDCFVDGFKVDPQPGRFYGGWVTPEVVGPFKGEPGSEWW